MPGFNAAEVVSEDDLDFDFSKYVEGVKGRIPEPSAEALDKFYRRGFEIAKDAGINIDEVAEPGERGRAALVKALANAPEGATEKMRHAEIEATAELCQGTPSVEQIEALPYRIQQAFTAWLMAKFADPTRRNGATSS
jgi:hypothetical protein